MKARSLALAASLIAALALAGCFTSDTPLFSDDQAVAPYATITFAEHKTPEDKTTVTRQGKSYVAKLDSGSMILRFMPVGDDLYLAESASGEDGKIMRLYAVVALDAKAQKVMAYKVVAKDEDVGTGLTDCRRSDMDMICIADVDAYVALAKAAIASGAEPDTTYEVTLE